MDVKIESFSFNADTKPTVQWTKIVSENCLVIYFVEVTSWTEGKVQRGPISGSSVIVDDVKEPQYVTVFALKTNNNNNKTNRSVKAAFTQYINLVLLFNSFHKTFKFIFFGSQLQWTLKCNLHEAYYINLYYFILINCLQWNICSI